jgi:hypothetical protein
VIAMKSASFCLTGRLLDVCSHVPIFDAWTIAVAPRTTAAPHFTNPLIRIDHPGSTFRANDYLAQL